MKIENEIASEELRCAKQASLSDDRNNTMGQQILNSIRATGRVCISKFSVNVQSY